MSEPEDAPQDPIQSLRLQMMTHTSHGPGDDTQAANTLPSAFHNHSPHSQLNDEPTTPSRQGLSPEYEGSGNSPHPLSAQSPAPNAQYSGSSCSPSNEPVSGSTVVPPLTPSLIMTSFEVAQISRQVKRARKLGPQSETEIDIFLAGNALYREAQQYAATLECRDMLQTLVRDIDWDIPAALKSTAHDYAWAYILSPSITSYRSYEGPARVLRIMRKFNISGLPPAHETGRCEVLEACIGKNMTDCRHHIKGKVNDTLKSDTRVAKDIGSLTAQIIARTRIKATAALYLRIANIRWAMTEYPVRGSAEEGFWVKFDSILDEQRQTFKEPAQIQAAVQLIYDRDAIKYGQPDLARYPPTAADRQEDWVMALDTSAAGVSTPATEGSGTRRRKHRT